MTSEESRAETSRASSVYGHTLKMVLSFKYMGRLISAADDDWPVVIRNLAKAQVVWWIMWRFLSREGARPQVSGFF